MQSEREARTLEAEPALVRNAYRTAAFGFHGSASEYFRIWVVDTALSWLTLGVFSPWASARSKRYFARNTFVEGSSFDYVGKPSAFACRRLTAVVLLGAALWGSHRSVGIGWGLILVAALLPPWLSVASRAFDVQNLLYRNVRFRFEGRLWETVFVCARASLLYLASFGFAHPYVVFGLHRYFVTRCRWGALRFDWFGHSGPYLGACALAACLTYPMYVALVDLSSLGILPPLELAWSLFPWLLLFAAYLLVPIAFVSASSKNLFYNGIQVGEHLLSANFRAQDLLKLYVTNTLAVIVSFGLLIPWARVRSAAYEASCLTLQVRR